MSEPAVRDLYGAPDDITQCPGPRPIAIWLYRDWNALRTRMIERAPTFRQ